MPDVLICHLRLRVIRTSSLFWGADPRALARRGLAALPELLADELGRLGVGEHRALDLPAPLRLRLRGTGAGLAGALEGAERSGELRSAIRAALEEALASAGVPAPAAAGSAEPADATSELPPPRSAMGALLRLHLAGELPARLREMETGLLLAYHRLLLLDPAPAADPPPRPATAAELEESERMIGALAVGLGHAGAWGGGEERIRERIIGAIAIAAGVGVAPSDRGVRALLDRLLPADEPAVYPEASARPAESSPDNGLQERLWEPPLHASGKTKRGSGTEAEVRADQLAPILPLLAAAWLARHRGLADVVRHLDRMRRGEELPLWIAGLAFKLGPAPDRGWIYQEETWRAVATIADYPLLSGQELVHFADDRGAGWEELTATLLGEGTEHELELDPLLVARPACALASKPEFNQHINRVAGWVLTQIALVLWPEALTPIAAAFRRLMSLEVTIRRTEHGLAVRVPLGKRRNDLLRAGLLEDVHAAPWLKGGGSVRFHGG